MTRSKINTALIGTCLALAGAIATYFVGDEVVCAVSDAMVQGELTDG